MALRLRAYQIQIRCNTTTRSHGISEDRSTATLDQLGGGITDLAELVQLTKDEHEVDHKEWKKHQGMQHGKRRRLVEIVNRRLRWFGDSVAAKWENIIQEINLKANINNMLQIQREAIAMV